MNLPTAKRMFMGSHLRMGKKVRGNELSFFVVAGALAVLAWTLVTWGLATGAI
jgi:hypothetical protein